MTSNYLEQFFLKYPKTTYTRGKQLILVGDKAEQVFYIVSGIIDQYDISDNGDKVILNSFKSGAFLPMSDIINGINSKYFYEVRTANAVAHAAPASEVISMLKSAPGAAYELLSRVYKGVDGLLDRVNYMMSGTAGERLAHYLIVSANRFGEATTEEDVVRVRMTVSHIAEYTGLARETVSREMRKLKDGNIVELPSQGVVMINTKLIFNKHIA